MPIVIFSISLLSDYPLPLQTIILSFLISAIIISSSVFAIWRFDVVPKVLELYRSKKIVDVDIV